MRGKEFNTNVVIKINDTKSQKFEHKLIILTNNSNKVEDYKVIGSI